MFNDNLRLNVCNVDSSLKWFVQLSIAYTGATPDVMAMSAMPGKEVTCAAATSKSPGDEQVSGTKEVQRVDVKDDPARYQTQQYQQQGQLMHQ